jgi:hypothetical protein
MSIASGVKSEIKTAQKMRLPWWAVLCLLIGGMPLPWLFDHFGKLNLMLPIWNTVAVFGFLIALKWKLRRFAWFWITMIILAAFHVPLVLFVPWTTKWIPALMIAVIDSVDFCLMLWIISIVGKFMEEPKPSNDGDSSSSDTTSTVP